MRALLAHNSIGAEISEKDRSILAYLEDIKLNLHEKGFGFTLTFVFEANAYLALFFDKNRGDWTHPAPLSD